MRLGRLARKAKETVDKRGGSDSLKEDAAELREVAKGKGSLKDKAKAAGKAIKEPGAADQPRDPGASDLGGPDTAEGPERQKR